jgi:hypothetical protein
MTAANMSFSRRERRQLGRSRGLRAFGNKDRSRCRPPDREPALQQERS